MAYNMNGFLRNFQCMTSPNSQKQLCEMGKTGIITPILKMVKPRPKEVACFIQGQDWSAAPVSTKSCFLFSPEDPEGDWEHPVTTSALNPASTCGQ